MKKIILLLSALIFCSVGIKAQTVTGDLKDKIVRRGTKSRGKIILQIPEGVHVNSSLPKTEFAIPTKLIVRAAGIRITKIKYEKGTDKQFEFFETPINVYENRAEFEFEFFVPKGFRSKNSTLLAQLFYQACTLEICYQPTTATIKLDFTVK